MARDTRIKDVERKFSDHGDNPALLDSYASEGAVPLSRDAFPTFVDEPCVEACQILYDLNIETINSGANVDGKENVESEAFIGFNYLTLSPENQAIADAMEEVGLIGKINRNQGSRGAFTVRISVRMNSNSTVGEISDRLRTFAKFFKQQDVLYERVTRKDIEKCFKETKDGKFKDNLITLGEITKEERDQFIEDYLSSKFPSEDGYYFSTQDLLDKHNAYLKSQKENQK